ncbi:hypothetical protein SAMN06264364_101361 [Quadrisphaera granulorum]|uniref:Uncharacterized protein n=1 Tax=Quadrisphaera granulorum TaxID=317664 RepID=A0A316AF63_9ACTN|nr:hypothetical protein [Quadrisphaera granulorum]PWJ56383.1 hypothetical protein BXY45_101361 [Quadrisphaera granulorum]SZE95017.1 hypothetical protein SAMN06264364_101361 [Quadrisphaera granulorum]
MSAAAAARPEQLSVRRARRHPALLGVAVLFALAVLARATFSAWHPPLDQHIYDVADIRSHGPNTWLLMHALVGGPGVAVALTGLAVLVGVACPGRGSALAAVGGVLASLGGLAFCAAMAAEGVSWWYATADGVLPPAVGAEAMGAFAAHPLPIDVPALGGSLTAALGVLLLLGALWRAAVAPRWLVLSTAVLALITTLRLPTALVAAQAVAEAAALLALGWYALRAAGDHARSAGISPAQAPR